jgi:hypothetical protein
VVGGLAVKGVTFPTELRLRKIACIGDREELIDKKGVILVPAAPRLAKTLQLQIVDWHLMIPRRADFESRVRTMVTKQMNLKNSAKSKIVSRKLKIGQCSSLLFGLASFLLILGQAFIMDIA